MERRMTIRNPKLQLSRMQSISFRRQSKWMLKVRERLLSHYRVDQTKSLFHLWGSRKTRREIIKQCSSRIRNKPSQNLRQSKKSQLWHGSQQGLCPLSENSRLTFQHNSLISRNPTQMSNLKIRRHLHKKVLRKYQSRLNLSNHWSLKWKIQSQCPP